MKPFKSALVIHGGAGAHGPAEERAPRRQAMIAAVKAGAALLRAGGEALDAVIAAVKVLEDHELFNAGYGAVLNTAGRVEADAAVMLARPGGPSDGPQAQACRGGPTSAPIGAKVHIGAGAVAAVSRVRHPVELARAVMERTPHLLMAGAGAERLAAQAKITRCRPHELISPRARERWRARIEASAAVIIPSASEQGTVGAVALDWRGTLAAATSTGGVSGKLPGRIGDSAIIGAGVFADLHAAASATGEGEAIMKAALCRQAVQLAGSIGAQNAAERAIRLLAELTGGRAGLVLVSRKGQIGFAHNAQTMEVALLDSGGFARHLWLAPLAGAGPARRRR